jgi:hypothetical protein
MNNLTAKIRGFLLQHPKPARVRLTGDGEPQEIKPGKSYARLAESINALGGNLLECLDASGQITRAMKLDEDPAQLSGAPALPAGLQSDPHALMLTHFANLVARAYEHSTEIAFVKLVEVVEKMNDRSDAIEQRLERAEAQNRRMLLDQTEREIDLAEERAEQAAAAANGESAGDIGTALVHSFLGGAMQNGTKAPVNGVAKGKS